MLQVSQMSGKVTFKDNSESAKNGILAVQYKAMREAASLLVKAVREKSPKRQKKRLMYNIQARTYTRKKYGFVVAHIGVLDRAHAKRVPYAGFYAAQKEFGTSESPAEPFLRPGVQENIRQVREKLAEHLPGLINLANFQDIDEEVED